MINALAILFCLTLIYLAVTTRLSAYVLILVLQGGLVAGVHTLAFFHYSLGRMRHRGGVLLIRTFLIPTYIAKIMRDLDMRHGDARGATIPVFSSRWPR